MHALYALNALDLYLECTSAHGCKSSLKRREGVKKTTFYGHVPVKGEECQPQSVNLDRKSWCFLVLMFKGRRIL